jgi:hypothetical protein
VHIEFFVEEPSAQAFVTTFVPPLLSTGATFKVHVFQGKHDLLKALPRRLRGYRRIPDDWRLAVLVDEDRQDCHELKQRLETAAAEAGFTTKTTAARDGGFVVLNRLAIEELEAWFLGDVEALCAAYPGVPTALGDRAAFRDPDAVTGGTAEALLRVLKKAGHYSTVLPKIEVARRVTPHMDPRRNRSRSFRHFVSGLRELQEPAKDRDT